MKYLNIIHFTYDDSTSLSESKRSRSFLIFGPSFVVLLALVPSVLLLDEHVGCDANFVTDCSFVDDEVFVGETEESSEELTDIFSCSPVFFSDDFCLFVTETCEL